MENSDTNVSYPQSNLSTDLTSVTPVKPDNMHPTFVNDLDLWPSALKINGFHPVIKGNICATLDQIQRLVHFDSDHNSDQLHLCCAKNKIGVFRL